jgi:cytochrome c oxidase subunit 1
MPAIENNINVQLNIIDSKMPDFRKRPYHLLLLTALIILMASFFASNETLDIHLHDTYFIIALTNLFAGISVLLLILWLLYLFTSRLLFSNMLTWIHILSTTIAFLLLVVFSFYSNYYYEGLAGMPRRYPDYDHWRQLSSYNHLTTAVYIIFLVICLGVLVFVVNLFVGVIKAMGRT